MTTTDPVLLLPAEAPEAARTIATEAANAPPASLADASAAQAAEVRYLAALDKLVDDAIARKRVEVLADALAWTIARILVGCGLAAVGDVLRRLGEYVGDFTSRQRAQEEAKTARDEGRPMH